MRKCLRWALRPLPSHLSSGTGEGPGGTRSFKVTVSPSLVWVLVKHTRSTSCDQYEPEASKSLLNNASVEGGENFLGLSMIYLGMR